MASEQIADPKTEREFHVDSPDDLGHGEQIVLLLSLHGGGSSGIWQRGYFPAHDSKDEFRIVIATPTARRTDPPRWLPDEDDDHLRNIVELMLDTYNVRSFWLVGHSQGGMTSNRLLRTAFFADRVDGWLSLSGGRIGPAERAEGFGPPGMANRPRPSGIDFEAARRALAEPPEADFSFTYATGEHEIASLPETSPWAERYRAGPRVRLPDVVDDQPGNVHDGREGMTSLSWGREPRPGTAQIYVFPDALDGRLIADVVRLDKGHTEGLEPNITRELVRMIAQAPGGKARS